MQEFIDFVTSQNPEQRINHANWHSCAIGEYAGSIDQLPPSERHKFNPRKWGSQVEICIDSLQDLYIPKTDKELTMYDVLCNGFISTNHSCDGQYDVDTYGGLMNLIQWCIKEQ